MLVPKGWARPKQRLLGASQGTAKVLSFLADFFSVKRPLADSIFSLSQVFDALKADWQKEEPGFDFSECLEAARGEDTWDVGFKSHLANDRPASDPRIVLVPEVSSHLSLYAIKSQAGWLEFGPLQSVVTSLALKNRSEIFSETYFEPPRSECVDVPLESRREKHSCGFESSMRRR